MISAVDLIRNNPKLDIFNEIDKYMNNMPEYFIKSSYINNIASNFNKYTKIINNSICLDKHYKCKNDIIIYISKSDDNLMKIMYDNDYFTYQHRILLIYKLLSLSKKYNLSFLDAFIMLFFVFKRIGNEGDIFLQDVIDGIKNIFYSIKSKLDEIIKNNIYNIYNEINLKISKILSSNNHNTDIIDLFKYYITGVYINNILGEKSNFSFNDTVINNYKINNDIIDNILDKIINKKYNNALITDLDNIALKYNTSIIIVFVLLICNNNYYRIKGINKGIWSDIKSLRNIYINEDIADIIDITIYNINNKQNNKQNIITDNIIKQNELYYIQRDKFNIKYKRIYKCIDIINNLDIVIMECIDNSGINTQQYVLSEEDCNFLNIEYKDNLEVFSTKLNWINIDNNK